jgi:hypothetical protein
MAGLHIVLKFVQKDTNKTTPTLDNLPLVQKAIDSAAGCGAQVCPPEQQKSACEQSSGKIAEQYLN